MNKEENVIYKGISSIKHLNEKVANELYEIKDEKIDSFLDLLVLIKEKGMSVNSKQMKILIELDFFSEFGSIKQLLKQYEFFLLFYGKKQIKKEKAIDYDIPTDILEANSEKETPKQFSGINSYGMLKDLFEVLPYPRTSIYEKLRYQQEHLGYIDIKDENMGGYVVVLKVDTKYSPRVTAYSIKNGTVFSAKILKKYFKKNVINEGDIILILKSANKPKVKMDENGNFVPMVGEEPELWLYEYKMVSKVETKC